MIHTVTAHTGSTKAKTYKVVTGTVAGYRSRPIGPNHYTVDVVIIDADGVEYVTGTARIISEKWVAEPAKAAAPVKPMGKVSQRRAERAAYFAAMRERMDGRKVERTPKLSEAYGRYISDGLADTDGYYAPLDFQAWAATVGAGI
jgi:hypothetical protein